LLAEVGSNGDRWANDDPLFAPCPLVDKKDPVGINNNTPKHKVLSG
jgi:hypothetical protein